jgi:rod shape determining protein RodA
VTAPARPRPPGTLGYTAPVPRRASVRERLLDRDSPLWRLDWLLILAVAGLCVIGALAVWGATRNAQLAHHLDPAAYLKKDVLNIVIGVLLAFGAAIIDYRTLRAYTPVLYAASIVGLLAVFAIGTTINGSHSWISIGAGFEVQPSEFAKVAVIVGMAMLLSEERDGESQPRTSDIVSALGVAAFPMLLIMLQPDLGTTMVLTFVILGMIALSGAPSRWVLGLILLGLLGAFLVVKLHILHSYQLDRFRAFTEPNAPGAAKTYAYNTQQARIAIGHGGLFGQGLFHGSQTNGGFVPEQQTDFVFTVIGEEFGFVGGAVVVFLIGLVLWRALRVASRAEDAFGRLVAVGIVCWFGFQAFENIGMTLGIMPVTGLPLPFVSYGGSSMFADLIGIGLLQNVHLRTQRL